jgi:hypothetical protein
MVAEPDLLVRLHRLRTELRADVDAMEARAAETRTLVESWDEQGTIGRADLVLIAVNLHGWYTAFEAALERTARQLDQTVPTGSSWHVDLLDQMRIEMPGLRSALIPEGTLILLHELRKFRHFFRNAYVLELDAPQVRARATNLALIADPVASRLRDFLSELTTTVEALPHHQR